MQRIVFAEERKNPSDDQNSYTVSEMDLEAFLKLWNHLERLQENIFLYENDEQSDIFKCFSKVKTKLKREIESWKPLLF